jgi:hypothetical protein
VRASYATPAQTALEEAVAAATEEPRLVGQIARAAGTGSWRAAAFLLERRFPERWAPPPRATEVPRSPLDDDLLDDFAEVDSMAEARRRRESRKPPPGF